MDRSWGASWSNLTPCFRWSQAWTMPSSSLVLATYKELPSGHRICLLNSIAVFGNGEVLSTTKYRIIFLSLGACVLIVITGPLNKKNILSLKTLSLWSYAPLTPHSPGEMMHKSTLLIMVDINSTCWSVVRTRLILLAKVKLMPYKLPSTWRISCEVKFIGTLPEEILHN